MPDYEIYARTIERGSPTPLGSLEQVCVYHFVEIVPGEEPRYAVCDPDKTVALERESRWPVERSERWERWERLPVLVEEWETRPEGAWRCPMCDAHGAAVKEQIAREG
jgi:hypothetical protein